MINMNLKVPVYPVSGHYSIFKGLLTILFFNGVHNKFQFMIISK